MPKRTKRRKTRVTRRNKIRTRRNKSRTRRNTWRKKSRASVQKGGVKFKRHLQEAVIKQQLLTEGQYIEYTMGGEGKGSFSHFMEHGLEPTDIPQIQDRLPLDIVGIFIIGIFIILHDADAGTYKMRMALPPHIAQDGIRDILTYNRDTDNWSESGTQDGLMYGHTSLLDKSHHEGYYNYIKGPSSSEDPLAPTENRDDDVVTMAGQITLILDERRSNYKIKEWNTVSGHFKPNVLDVQLVIQKDREWSGGQFSEKLSRKVLHGSAGDDREWSGQAAAMEADEAF